MHLRLKSFLFFNPNYSYWIVIVKKINWSETEFKEVEPRLKYYWFHTIFQDLSRRGAQFKPVFGGFETRLKFIKFRHWISIICNQINLNSASGHKVVTVKYRINVTISFCLVYTTLYWFKVVAIKFHRLYIVGWAVFLWTNKTNDEETNWILKL